MTFRARRIVVASLTALALAVTGACAGDDDVETAGDDTTEQAADEGSVEEYCEFSAELDSRDAAPSEADLDRIESLAPAEIRDDVETIAQAVRDQDFEGTDEADGRLRAWEDDNCPQDDADATTSTTSSSSSS